MKVRYILFLMVIVITGAACNRLLDVKPKQSIDSDIALNSPEAAQAALNSVYARLRPVAMYGRDLIAIPELLADNTTHTANPIELNDQQRNLPGAHMNPWQNCYFAINEVNNLLAALPDIPGTQEFTDRIAGQAYFLRALYYHTLMKVYAYDPTAIVEEVNYGGVPLMLKPVKKFTDIEYKPRATIDEVYGQIYSDLEMAESMLEGKAIGGSDPEFYASAGAAAALWSRVALHKGDYKKVIAEATTALNSNVGSFATNAGYVNAWRAAKHPESMFELSYLIADNIGVNESLRATFTSRNFLTSASFVTRGNVVVSNDLYSKYSTSDVRRQLIMNGVGRNNGRNEMTKFLSKSGTANLDNVPVIRISEMYLNRAEAYARDGQHDLARKDVNMIRERAGLTPVASTLQGEPLIEEILLQRRLELAFEGHRFFDLKRLGKDIIKPEGNVRFDEFRILPRIPIAETQRNNMPKQNFGY